MNHLSRSLTAFLASALSATSAFAADAWAELATPGAIVLFRHATAPGVGDPPGFTLDDCATQRNLGELPGGGDDRAPEAKGPSPARVTGIKMSP